MKSLKKIFTPQNLEMNLPTRVVGKTILVYDEVDSTNDLLKPIMQDPHYNGLAIFARHQRKGRGRENRSWVAKPDSSIICSVLVFLEGKLADLAGPIAIAGAISSAQAVSNIFHLPAKIKWPNDIYLAKKKLSGMLVESAQVKPKLAGFIIGIGINVAQTTRDFSPELQTSAGSISQALDRPVDGQEMVLLARELLIQLDTHLDLVGRAEYTRLRHDWLTLAGGADQPVIVTRQDQTFHARIIDIDHRDNSLLVQDPQGLILHLHQNTAKIIG
jgi:BirA family transcriptional regulator, biotin operon repressor / biotin---[acetyl-CoA-carboxylase] ligase